MEVRKSPLVGTIVGFVVAERRLWPDKGREFTTPQEAMDARLRGFFFKKLQLESGQILWSLGLKPGSRVGDRLFGARCSCGEMVWTPREQSSVQCEDCVLTELEANPYPEDDLED